jgi:hypothetical protein
MRLGKIDKEGFASRCQVFKECLSKPKIIKVEETEEIADKFDSFEEESDPEEKSEEEEEHQSDKHDRTNQPASLSSRDSECTCVISGPYSSMHWTEFVDDRDKQSLLIRSLRRLVPSLGPHCLPTASFRPPRVPPLPGVLPRPVSLRLRPLILLLLGFSELQGLRALGIQDGFDLLSQLFRVWGSLEHHAEVPGCGLQPLGHIVVFD